MTQQAERRRDRTSFQELAKLAQTPPPPSVSSDPLGVAKSSGPLSSPAASSPLVWPSTPNVNAPASVAGPWSSPVDSDSGMVDLKAIAQAEAATQQQERAKSTPLAADGLFDDAPAASVAPAVPSSVPVSGARASAVPSTQPSPGQPISQAAPVPMAMQSAAPAVSAVTALPTSQYRQDEKKSRLGLVIGLVAAFGAVAAGSFFFVAQRRAANSAVAMAPAVAPVQKTEPAKVEPVEAKPVEAAPVAVAEAPVEAPKEEPVAAAKGRHAKPTKGAKAEPLAAATKPAEPETKESKAGGAAAGFAGSLKDEMEKRVGPGEKAPEVAAQSNAMQANVGPKPSQGQVQGAIGAVLMKARECLGPDDAVSKANVVFASAGTVQSVSVSGGAAGKPAEACIKTALGKAKVPPFTDATYSFPVTVRPL